MKPEFTSRFIQDLKKIQNPKIKDDILRIIDDCELATKPTEIKNIRKLKGYDCFFRINVGSYRIGISIEKELIIFSRCLPRKDIYKYFPD